MWTRLIAAVGLKGILVGLLVAGVASTFIYWVNWTVEANRTLVSNAETIKQHEETINTLRGEIQQYLQENHQLEEKFYQIEQSQSDLLCAARYGQPVQDSTVQLPLVKEVVVYRDRMSKCPTLDINQAEVTDSLGTALRPSNEQIAVKVLENSWEAFCIANKQEHPSCLPTQ